MEKENIVKIISFTPSSKNTMIIEKPEKLVRKAITNWKIENKYMEFDNQKECLYCMLKTDEDISNEKKEACCEIRRQIQYKINSYRGQDIKKGIYNENEFVNYEFVLNLLVEKQMKCFYCRENVMLLYNHVRENKQWTLERINNDIGHNIGNVEIACLICNLRRRTMYHERYVFTKQLSIVKLGE